MTHTTSPLNSRSELMQRFLCSVALVVAVAGVQRPAHAQAQPATPLYLVLDGHMYPLDSYSTSSYGSLTSTVYALDIPGGELYNCNGAQFDGVWRTVMFYGYVAPPVMVASIMYSGYHDAGGDFYAFTVNSRFGGVTCSGEVPVRAGYHVAGDVIFLDGFDAGGVPAGDAIFANGFD